MSDVRDGRRDERPFDGQRDATGVMLHEERLRAGVERVEAGRVEVRKRIVTDEVTLTIPVRREVVDVVRVYDDGSEEAIEMPASPWAPQVEFADASSPRVEGGDSPTALDGRDDDGVFDGQRAEREARAAGQNGEQDIVLYEERPFVSTRLYAVERIHLGVTGQTEVVPVTAEVQREVVEVDGVVADGVNR